MVNRKHNLNMFRKSKLSDKEGRYAFLDLPKTRKKKEKTKHQSQKLLKRSLSKSYQKATVRRKPKKRRLGLVFALIFIIIFSSSLGLIVSISSKFALLEIFLTMMSTTNFVAETNILVIGLDNVRGTHRTDTIMIVNIKPNTKKVSVVSIPRDTIVPVPGLGLTKINHAFTYGGTKLTKKTLEKFLDIRIPFTTSIDMAGLARIIDQLGGITINVEKRMYYVDHAGGLYIDLYPGKQRLSGRKAIGYVRFRSDARGDIARISRQQKFVKALAQKIVTHKSVLKTPKLIMALLSNVNTNLNSRQVLGISMSMRQALELGRIEMATIPGYPIMINNVYYLKPNIYETKRIVSRMLRSSKKRSYVTNNYRLVLKGASQ